jgi:glutamine synthetase
MPKTANDAVKLATDTGIKIVDLRFVDLPGMWQHFSIPVEDLEEKSLHRRNRLRWLQHSRFPIDQRKRHAAFSGPGHGVCRSRTGNSHADHHLRCEGPDHRGSRIAATPATWFKRRRRNLKGTGITDVSYWGPELEFYVFDDVRYDQTAFTGYYRIDSDEGIWNTG